MLAGKSLSESIADRTHTEDGQPEGLDRAGRGLSSQTGADAEGIAQALAELEALDGDGASKPRAVTQKPRRLRAPLLFLAIALAAVALVPWRLMSMRAAVVTRAATSHAEPEFVNPEPAPATKTAPPAVEPSKPIAPEPAPASGSANQHVEEAEAQRLAPEAAPDAAQIDGAQRAHDQAAANAVSAPKPEIAQPPASPSPSQLEVVRADPTEAASPAVAPPAANPASIEVVKTAIAPGAPKPEAVTKSAKKADVKKLGIPKSDLETGQALLAAGKLAAARRSFEKAVQSGLPEGALALGNTYDPLSLAKLGLKDSGNPELARHWYRRAHEIALQQR